MAFYQRLNPRLFVLSGLLALLFLILAGGLAWQQLWKSSTYEQLELRQSRRRILQPGPRGRILDRNGVPLVENKASYSVVLYVGELRKEFSDEFIKLKKEWLARAHDDTTEAHPTLDSNKLMWTARYNVARRYLDKANALLGRQSNLDEKAFTLHVQQKPLLPFTLVPDISESDFARFNEEVPVESHMQTRVEARRFYPYGSLAFHTLGWVGMTNEYDEEDWQVEGLPEHSTFALRGMTGLHGLELLHDNTLSGKSGGEILLVDPANARVQRIEQKSPEPGHDFVSSLDVNIQRVAEQQLTKDHKDIMGSVAVLDVRTGEVLALASKPDFDLNQTAPSMPSDFMQMVGQTEEGWYNRATQVSYPPGSTFKVVDCIAGLRSGVLNATITYECPGSIMVGNHKFSDHDYPEGLGNIGMVYALYMSSDVFFYKAGLDIGHDRIAEEARRLGLGQKTSIEVTEAPTSRLVVPDDAWRKAHHMSPWNDGDTVNMAIGQGDLLVTPLQMACLAASIARDETRTVPTLVHNPNLPPDMIIHRGEPLGLTPEQRGLLLDGMEKAASIGTARIINTVLPGIRVAGKTGTAQWNKNGKALTVAWLVCFAPIDNPRIAVAMAIESPDPQHQYYGGPTCGPYVAEILKEYFKRYPTETTK